MTRIDADASPPADRRLEPLLHATDEAREQRMVELIVEVAEPQARRVIDRYAQFDSVSAEDAEDIVATVALRLVTLLRGGASSGDEAIRDFDSYVSRLTYNALNDHFRRRFPQRTRLKNRLRYALTHDPRLGLWTAGERLVCGLARWQGKAAGGIPSQLPVAVLQRQQTRPAEALVRLFEAIAGPVVFDALVDLLADVWHVVDAPPAGDQGARRSAESAFEWRQFLGSLWSEAMHLRPMQRKALLLNLRDAETSHVLNLFVLTGIASFEAIAEAVELTPRELEAIWHDLPLDDLTIASRLGVTRQQVINLRKSARERLARRLSYRKERDE